MILMKTVKLYRTDTDIPAEVLTIRRKRPNTRSINEYRYPLLCFLRYTGPFLGGTRAHSTVCVPPRPAFLAEQKYLPQSPHDQLSPSVCPSGHSPVKHKNELSSEGYRTNKGYRQTQNMSDCVIKRLG